MSKSSQKRRARRKALVTARVGEGRDRPSPTFCGIADRQAHYLPELGLLPVNRGPGDVPAYRPPPIIRTR